jgi:DNA processing protein
MPTVMPAGEKATRRRYRAPEPDAIALVPITSLVDGARTIAPAQQARLPGVNDSVFCVGDQALARQKSVAVVGSRKVSEAGAKRARQLARELVKRGVVVVSGLAYGVDINAHTSAIEHQGKTIAVIGTPVDKAYPAAHAEWQEKIYREHLLISPFAVGSPTYPSSFPERNKIMAAISDATCIVEAGDTSGSLSQARECLALGRWLFILRSVLSSNVKWPADFLNSADASKAAKVRVVDSVEDIIAVL